MSDLSASRLNEFREPDKDGGSPMQVSKLLTTAALALVLGVTALQTNASAQLGSRLLGRDRNAPREVPAPAFSGTTPLPGGGAANRAPANDKMVLPANSALPTPLSPEEMGKATIVLPTVPIEPYLLTKDNGPFMVLAHTFRGPDANRYALALAIELRNDFKLPAYILRTRDMPGRSNIRNVPPTAAEAVRSSMLGQPERYRTEDEAAVLVGDEKTLEASLAMLKKVQKLHPKCLDGIPNIWSFRKGKGLHSAIRTTNPYVPAEDLFPRKADPLIAQMNGGPHSLMACNGRYSLQVAEFMGRQTFTPGSDSRFQGIFSLRNSPLVTAHEDAEKLAAALARDKQFIGTGYRPYVFHDRTSSRVLVGAFNNPNDPAANELREYLKRYAGDFNNRKTSDVLIVPALALTDVQRLQSGRQQDFDLGVMQTGGTRKPSSPPKR